ncbi:TFIIB-type zinc ribbon-containing protein [Nannocystis pusilla]|uniref:TFIIB-type zinc ribbon-containing protein n=1 Tax=Nannocystis pusilla TaxID=889268 RepID=UPI003DA380D7
MPKRLRRPGPPLRFRQLHDREPQPLRPGTRESILVVCPRCDGCARLVTLYSDDTPPSRQRRMHCPACGAIREEPIGLPYWLQTDCCGHVLWATGAEHLQELEDYVRSPLRERLRLFLPDRYRIARLPRWLILARHRDEVLRGLARLRRLLPTEG